jgi:hypothetical protein
VAVCADDEITGDDKAFFGKQSVFYAAGSPFVEVRNAVFF